MFENSEKPRVFGLAPGVDFPWGLMQGLLDRVSQTAPEKLARVQLIVNTTRMQRRLRALFDTGPARLLPKIHLVTQLDQLAPGLAVPPPVKPLRRRLELIALVARLIEQQEALAPRTSLYDLTDSLASLMDEMQGEGVTADTINGLDVSDISGHWQRTQTFIRIAQDYLAQTTTQPDKEAQQRQFVCALADRWAVNPPRHPVILAGSTGSRGTTMLLMEAIARLPQGALVLPGFDFDMPRQQWMHLDDALLSEDHPQYRFYKLMQHIGVQRPDITPWYTAAPPSPARNALVSLSLRPAPVTNAWLTEGPKLHDLNGATARITLVEAPSPRSEALAIALRLRRAVEDGQKAAVITPDRMLTRQITAALDQFDILPDDSAGAPLHLSPPGRFLRHVAALFHRRLDAEALLTLLKHPLTHSGTNRAMHILNTQRLELRIRRDGLPYPDAGSIRAALAGVTSKPEDQNAVDAWAAWVGHAFATVQTSGERPLTHWAQAHIALAEAISSGPDGKDTGEIWKEKAGQEALKVMTNLADLAHHGGQMTASDYGNLVGALLSEGEVRDRDAPHPDIMIWGTLEARVQGADLVILAGLNDGTWPEAPAPDPWLNRALRHQAGLLLPERRIGLAAHDYQQAIAAPEVWLTRSVRSDDAETVASRWVNRLCNLLSGLKGQDGPALLAAMKKRGEYWLDQTVQLEKVERTAPAQRPAPRPPLAARPKRLAVTDIKHLIRDPYAIYAKHVLRLRKLGPLVQNPDALLRGTVSHRVMEQFVKHTLVDPATLSAEDLVDVAQEVLGRDVPWPAARALWLARLRRISAWFVVNERARQDIGTPVAFEDEALGKMVWSDIGFTLTARADRIDQTECGDVLIYDYKTGSPPTVKQQQLFDKQLLIEAAMVEQGAFEKLGPQHVAYATFIGLGSNPAEVPAPLESEPPAQILAELRKLVLGYQDENQGFTARRMMEKDQYGSDYDLLSRYGEWDVTQDPVQEDVS